MKHAIWGLLGFAALALSTSAAEAADTAPCTLKVYATLDINPANKARILVPVTVAGQTQTFLVDTGSPFTSIGEAQAKKLGLQLNGLGARAIRMFDGTSIVYGASAPSIMIGKLAMPSTFSFMVMPENEKLDADGLLGTDVLSIFDLDFDFGGNKMHLIAPSDCGDAVVYWTGDYAKVPISLTDANGFVPAGKIRVGPAIDTKHVYAHADLDGKDVKVMFDTGAPFTAIRYSQARFLLGLSSDDPNMKRLDLKRPDGLPEYIYTFKTLTIGGITVHNPVLHVLGSPEEKVNIEEPMLVGMDVLRKLHIYLSYQNHMMYVSPAMAAAAAPATKTN